MDITYKRFAMFLLLCIPIRVLIAHKAMHASSSTLHRMGMAALVPAIGFMYIYLTGSRKTGGETFGEQIWWNSLRPIHSFLYFSFAISAFNNSKSAYKSLVLDVLLGFISFIHYHFK